MGSTTNARIPSYRPHRATGQARVTIDGRDHYLGAYGSDDSKARYKRLVAEYLNAGAKAPEPRPAGHSFAPYFVTNLCEDFNDWAGREYRTANGDPTRSVENVRQAMKNLFELYSDVDAAQFGPRSLVLLREDLARRGLARTTINDRVKLIRRAFKWATQEEKIPPSVFHGLQSISGLRRGRGGARETEPIRPVPEKYIAAALPFMPEPVAALVQIQLLTGARPGEVLLMRAVDIDRTGKVWVYKPSDHKNAWRGQERSIYLGPKAQQIVLAHLRPGLQERFLFSPTQAELRRRARLRAMRKTPLFPSHVRAQERKRKANPKRKPRDHYDGCSYRQAIRRACKRAKVPAWRPNQLRHNAATQLRAEFGLDVAKAVLGHRRVETTQIYAEVDRGHAVAAIERVG